MPEEIMTNTKKLERLKDIEKLKNNLGKKYEKKYTSYDADNCLKEFEALTQEANKIGEEFKDGCGRKFWYPMYPNIECGKLFDFRNNCYFFCPICQEAKEILARINNG